MNQIDCTPTMTTEQPPITRPTNKRRAMCKHCGAILHPGEGVGYQDQFGYGGGTFYYCRDDAQAWNKIEADRQQISGEFAEIANWVGKHFDSTGGLDTLSGGSFGIACRNQASILYGRLYNLIMGCGVFRLEAASAVNLALVEHEPVTIGEALALAERVAVHMLACKLQDGSDLPWVSGILARGAEAWAKAVSVR